MKMTEAFPSKYLRADVDVCDEQPVVATIKEVEMETVGQGAQSDSKPVVYFREFTKGLVLNKTNAGIISDLYGDDSDDWAGKRVTLYATEVQFEGKMVAAIRIKNKAPKEAVKAKPAAAAVEDDDMGEAPF